ncbi:MAG: serine/threonine protein kinase [Oscillospiraceae bacterium]|jgi:preprotein translocase subunit YajC|nr:serine/threonine protein kinase [Oscillospiraceae bacterium]
MRAELAASIAMTVFSAVLSLAMGMLLFQMQRHMKRDEDERKAQNKAQKQYQLLTTRGLAAAITLGEATAIAQKNGKPNGETERALAYAQDVKHEQKDFLTAQAVDHIYQERRRNA